MVQDRLFQVRKWSSTKGENLHKKILCFKGQNARKKNLRLYYFGRTNFCVGESWLVCQCDQQNLKQKKNWIRAVALLKRTRFNFGESSLYLKIKGFTFSRYATYSQALLFPTLIFSWILFILQIKTRHQKTKVLYVTEQRIPDMTHHLPFHADLNKIWNNTRCLAGFPLWIGSNAIVLQGKLPEGIRHQSNDWFEVKFSGEVPLRDSTTLEFFLWTFQLLFIGVPCSLCLPIWEVILLVTRDELTKRIFSFFILFVKQVKKTILF